MNQESLAFSDGSVKRNLSFICHEKSGGFIWSSQNPETSLSA
jgi:hypothetical protein